MQRCIHVTPLHVEGFLVRSTTVASTLPPQRTMLTKKNKRIHLPFLPPPPQQYAPSCTPNRPKTPQHKLSQPIAVSGRMTRTATKVKPRLEFSGRAAAGGGAGAGSMASPTAGRAKRNAGGPGSANRRLHKSPRTSIDRGERAKKASSRKDNQREK